MSFDPSVRAGLPPQVVAVTNVPPTQTYGGHVVPGQGHRQYMPASISSSHVVVHGQLPAVSVVSPAGTPLVPLRDGSFAAVGPSSGSRAPISQTHIVSHLSNGQVPLAQQSAQALGRNQRS